MIKWFRINRRLKKEGILVESSYLLYLNNLEPISFENRVDLSAYLKKFRADNEIFKLQIYRIETYSI